MADDFKSWVSSVSAHWAAQCLEDLADLYGFALWFWDDPLGPIEEDS